MANNDIINAPRIREEKTGANYKRLPFVFKKNIEQNLQVSDAFKKLVLNGNKNKATEEWTVGLSGIKRKQKVIFSYENDRLTYTIKEKNKIILKTTSIERAANKIAEFYNSELDKMG